LQVQLIWQLLELVPFIAGWLRGVLYGFSFFLLLGDSSLNPINFIISALLSNFDLLDEVVWLQNSSVWLYLYGI